MDQSVDTDANVHEGPEVRDIVDSAGQNVPRLDVLGPGQSALEQRRAELRPVVVT